MTDHIDTDDLRDRLAAEIAAAIEDCKEIVALMRDGAGGDDQG